MLGNLRKRGMREQARRFAPLIDIVAAPGTFLSALHMRAVREAGIERLHLCREVLNRTGVFPLKDHYYEPLFRSEPLRGLLDRPRDLPGIDLRVEDQLSLLKAFSYQSELEQLARTGAAPGRYAYDNGNFGPGDAEILYSIVRQEKPQRILEVGSGYSTLVVREALKKNRAEDGKDVSHVCIEPFEMAWLEGAGVEVERKLVEEVDPARFEELEAGDILFIDSSHMIRPQGDVLYLYQRVLPRLKPGVWVHVHDIFTPYDYPERWLIERVCFWNEQYLLEALLADNPKFRVELSLNLLFQQHRDELTRACPVLKEQQNNPPKSFWMRRQTGNGSF